MSISWLEHLRSKWHRTTESWDDHRWSSLKEQAMQRKLRAREKRQIGTQVKFDSTKTINHQQTHVCSFEYTIIRKWLKQPLFLCYNKKYFILIHPLSSENTFSLHSKTKGSIYENIIRIRSCRNSFTKKWNLIHVYNKNNQYLNCLRHVIFLCNSPFIKYSKKSNRRS